jgi:hypothetical protein
MTDLPATSLQVLNEHFHGYLGWAPEQADSERVLFSYFGDISQHRIDNLLTLTEAAILDSGSKRRVMKRVCSILIECFQNASIHGVKGSSGKGSSFFVLLASAKAFRLIIGNLVNTGDTGLLTYRIDELNKLSTPELRKLYIETLCNQNYSYKGGAGLGLLTVAKKTSSPMVYRMIELDDPLSYFVLELTVSIEE